MSDQWHLLQEGQQYGPYTGDQLVEFAKDGRIVRESMLWAEGMTDWVAASQFEGLFPPAPVAAAVPSWAPPGARGGRPVAGVHPARPVPRGARSTRLMGPPQVVEVGGNYPPLDTSGASFGMLAAMFGGGTGLLLLGLMLAMMRATSGVAMAGSQVLMLTVVEVLGGVGILTAAILQYVYLARLWSYLRYGYPRTTPGKAVGFLFLPGFNLYWIFVAFYGLAQDWNRITSQFADLQRAPRMSEGAFLTFCIGCFFPPLGLVMWFVVMSQLCRSINYMAYRPVHHPGMIQFG